MKALQETYFFRNLNPRELERIAAIAEERSFESGTRIIDLDQEMTKLYVIREGRVRVIIPVEPATSAGAVGTGGAGQGQEADDEAEERLAVLTAGEAFGEFSYADRKTASAAVVALEKTHVFELTHHDLDHVLAADASIARKVLGAMLERVVSQLRSTDADLVLARYVLRVV